ncbi:MAG: head-tail connector protein [Pseudomonadota bacterium]
MSLTLIAAPMSEPITLDDMKRHLRLLTSDHDDSLSQLLVAARHALEARAGLAFSLQRWTYTLDKERVVRCSDVLLPLSPIKSVDAVTLIDHEGNRTPLDSGTVTISAGTISRLKFGPLPSADIRPLGGIEIEFTAGYETINLVPAELRHAVRLLTAHFFENRESVSETRVFSIPRTIDTLVAPYRRVSI